MTPVTEKREGLDPYPSNERIRELARQRGVEIPSFDADAVAKQWAGALTSANAAASNVIAGAVNAFVDEAKRAGIVVGGPARAKRVPPAWTPYTITGDAAYLFDIPGPPRTKKNSAIAPGAKASKGYIEFRNRVLARVMTKTLYQLRVQPGDGWELNLRALYYVDARGKRADLFGLHQALADALQYAGVVADDNLIRTTDGSRIIFADAAGVEPHVAGILSAHRIPDSRGIV